MKDSYPEVPVELMRELVMSMISHCKSKKHTVGKAGLLVDTAFEVLTYPWVVIFSMPKNKDVPRTNVIGFKVKPAMQSWIEHNIFKIEIKLMLKDGRKFEEEEKSE